MCRQDVIRIGSWKHALVGTDGLPSRMEENGHPRAFGAFPRALRLYVEELGLFTLEEMVHRMTGAAAERLNLPDKGLVRPGYDADFLLVDMARFRDEATYRRSNRTASGLKAVYVSGQAAWADGRLTGYRGGRFIRRRA